jgi:hypothetical protein
MELSGELHVLSSLHLEKQPPIPIECEATLAPERRAGKKIMPPHGLELRPLCRPTRSQSLYWLSYPGFQIFETYSFYSLDVPLIYSSTFCSVIRLRKYLIFCLRNRKARFNYGAKSGYQTGCCMSWSLLFVRSICHTDVPFLCLHALVLWNHRRHQ